MRLSENRRCCLPGVSDTCSRTWRAMQRRCSTESKPPHVVRSSISTWVVPRVAPRRLSRAQDDQQTCSSTTSSVGHSGLMPPSYHCPTTPGTDLSGLAEATSIP